MKILYSMISKVANIHSLLSRFVWALGPEAGKKKGCSITDIYAFVSMGQLTCQLSIKMAKASFTGVSDSK